MYRMRDRLTMFFLLTAFRGFYILYWVASVQNEIVRNERKGLSGGLTVLLILCTFGLYSFIWQWKACGILKKQGASDRRIITLVLGILIVGILINPLIIQGELNNLNPRMILKQKRN